MPDQDGWEHQAQSTKRPLERVSAHRPGGASRRAFLPSPSSPTDAGSSPPLSHRRCCSSSRLLLRRAAARS